MESSGGDARIIYYEVLRAATKDELEVAGPEMAAVHVSADDLGGRDSRTVREVLSWAGSRGITSRIGTGVGLLGLETVRSWLSQLSQPGARNVTGVRGTRHAYASALATFDKWLRGRRFPVDQAAPGGQPSRSFSNVEDLLGFCGGSDRGAAAARLVVRQYVAGLAASGLSPSTVLARCAAIKSYLASNDVHIELRAAGGRRGSRSYQDGVRMSLHDVYRLVTIGRVGAMERAVVMVKFQAGLDSSTLADRFNFEGYGQVVRHLGTGDYHAWDLDKCPVPIKLARVKTGVPYTTFLDRDAVSCLRDYLSWREGGGGGPPERDGPLFVTRMGGRITPSWVSKMFSRAAARAGIQERIQPGLLRVRSHEVRDLLKSTLLVAGCAPYAADHILGHSPRDSYEKQAILYPEAIRREYSKASTLLNVLGPAGGRPGGADAGADDSPRDDEPGGPRVGTAPKAGPSQMVTDPEGAEEMIAAGWRFVALLPNGRVVVERGGGAPAG